MAEPIKVDDRDLQYTGGYFVGPRGPDPEEYSQTDTTLETAGSTMSFTFSGSYIGVFGTVGPEDEGCRSTYSVDGLTPYTFTAPKTNETLYRLLLFQTTVGDFTADPKTGKNTIVVTSLDSGPSIDYVEYIPWVTTTTTIPSATSSSLVSSASSSVAIATSAISSTLSLSSILPISSTNSMVTAISTNNNLRSHKPNIGKIAVGAGGGILLVAMVLTLLFFLRRRRKRRVDATVEPYGPSYTLPIAPQSKSLRDVSAVSLLPSSSTSPSAPPTNLTELPSTQDNQQGQVESQAAAPISTQPRLHEDGGVRIQWPSQETSDGDIPPVYRQYISEVVITPAL